VQLRAGTLNSSIAERYGVPCACMYTLRSQKLRRNSLPPLLRHFPSTIHPTVAKIAPIFAVAILGTITSPPTREAGAKENRNHTVQELFGDELGHKDLPTVQIQPHQNPQSAA
jgi:hypothetical protein